MPHLLIAPPCPDDRPAMARLYEASVRRNAAGFIQDLSYHGDICAFADRLNASGGAFVVAKYAGNLVGLGGLRPETPEKAEICKLHVEEACLGQGYGRALAQDLMNRAAELGFNTVTLHVTTTQKAAIGLYRKLGFVEDKTALWQGNINGVLSSYETMYMHRDVAHSVNE